MGCRRCAPFPIPLPLLGRGSSRHPWGRKSGFILTLLCDTGEVSYPLWAQLPHLKNRDNDNHGPEQEPGAGPGRGASSPGEHSAADILLLFLQFFVALQLQEEARPLHLLLLLPGALSSIPGPNPVPRPPHAGTAGTVLMDMFFAQKKAGGIVFCQKCQLERKYFLHLS